MTTNYNHGHVAEQYRKAKEQPWRSLVETYTFMKRIGDLRGKKVLDVACGGGHFTRRLREGGASQVVGLDISERMIAQARSLEEQEPLGIEYQVEDARSVVPQQDFDLLVSAWLLVYAHDRPELASMCEGLASRLRPGGRLVTLTTNPDLYAFQPPPDYRKYGFTMTLADHVYEALRSSGTSFWTTHPWRSRTTTSRSPPTSPPSATPGSATSRSTASNSTHKSTAIASPGPICSTTRSQS